MKPLTLFPLKISSVLTFDAAVEKVQLPRSLARQKICSGLSVTSPFSLDYREGAVTGVLLTIERRLLKPFKEDCLSLCLRTLSFKKDLRLKFCLAALSL